MKNNDDAEITVRFDQFFEILNLSGIELEKKRQDLIKTDATREVNGKEHVLLPRCAKYLFDELNLLRMKAMASRSDEDIMNYAFASFDYFHVWTRVFASRIQSVSTIGEKVPIDLIRDAYKNALDDYQIIYEHLRTAFEISIEIDVSANFEE